MPPQVVQSRSGCAETQPEVLYSSLDAAALRRLEAQEDGTHLVPCVHHIGAVVPAHHWHSVPATPCTAVSYGGVVCQTGMPNPHMPEQQDA